MRIVLLMPLLFLVAGCASGPYEHLVISGETMQKLNSSVSINRRLAAVSFDRNKIEVCYLCLQNYKWRNLFDGYWEDLFDQKYPSLLKTVLDRSAIFDSHAEKLFSLKAQLVSYKTQEDFGSARTQLAVLYLLMDGNSVIHSWTVNSTGHANHFVAMDNLYESTYEAIAQNIIMFDLELIADTNPSDSERAKQEMAVLNQKMNTDNVSVGNIFAIGFGGAVTGVKAVGGAVGDGLSVVAHNSGAIAQSLNSTAAEMDRSNRSYNAAYSQAVLASRQQTSSSYTSAEQRSESSPSSANTAKPSSQSHTQVAADTQSAPLQQQQDSGSQNMDKCEYYLNENAVDSFGNRYPAAAESNARLRAKGIPACKDVERSGPSRAISR